MIVLGTALIALVAALLIVSAVLAVLGIVKGDVPGECLIAFVVAVGFLGLLLK